MVAAEGLLFFALGVVALIIGVLWISVPFMLYSMKSSLQEIEDSLDDLREIELEIARRLGPARSNPSVQRPAPTAEPEVSSTPLDRPLSESAGPRTRPQTGRAPSLRNQAEQIRRRFRD